MVGGCVWSDRYRAVPYRVRPAALLVDRNRFIFRLKIGHLRFEQLFAGRLGHAL
jgi:hypothetical protein